MTRPFLPASSGPGQPGADPHEAPFRRLCAPLYVRTLPPPSPRPNPLLPPRPEPQARRCRNKGLGLVAIQLPPRKPHAQPVPRPPPSWTGHPDAPEVTPPPPLLPRTNRTRLVPPLVLTGHAAGEGCAHPAVRSLPPLLPPSLVRTLVKKPSLVRTLVKKWRRGCLTRPAPPPRAGVALRRAWLSSRRSSRSRSSARGGRSAGSEADGHSAAGDANGSNVEGEANGSTVDGPRPPTSPTEGASPR